MPSLPIPVLTIGLLIASNVFMTFAWYGHLKFKGA
ncbi:MAG TPA: DMT family protein, partial [Paracoccaceae bacterium]|nr:DMT family protein [Paracoccaceae bacterium]